MFFFGNKKEEKTEDKKYLVDFIFGARENLTRYIKPELKRYITGFDYEKLNSTEEIDLFLKNFTTCKSLLTYRYLYVYLISPETHEFEGSIIYDKFTERVITNDPRNLYTFRNDTESQKIELGNQKVVSFDFYRFNYDLYGVLLTYNPEHKIYNVHLWTNFLPKYIIQYDIVDSIYLKSKELITKITALKNLFENSDKNSKENILPLRVELFYHDGLGAIVTAYTFQVKQYKIILHNDYFTQKLLEAYYKSPQSNLTKIITV
jgi:hypothetical protein